MGREAVDSPPYRPLNELIGHRVDADHAITAMDAGPGCRVTNRAEPGDRQRPAVGTAAYSTAHGVACLFVEWLLAATIFAAVC
jgi:hypothetical protein